MLQWMELAYGGLADLQLGFLLGQLAIGIAELLCSPSADSLLLLEDWLNLHGTACNELPCLCGGVHAVSLQELKLVKELRLHHVN